MGQVVIKKHVKNFMFKRFGKLVVYRFCGINKRKLAMWLCRCDCGNFHTTNGNSLQSGLVQSCGCLRKRIYQDVDYKARHGHSYSRTYKCWQNMKDRCYRVTGSDYPRYGGRGIRVCERWLQDYMNFLEDMGERPGKWTLDRLDVNGDYSPENCKWSSPLEQSINRRNTIYLELNGIKFRLIDCVRYFGVNDDNARSYYKQGGQDKLFAFMKKNVGEDFHERLLAWLASKEEGKAA